MLSAASESPKRIEEIPLMPSIAPFTSVEIASGAAELALEFADEAADSSTPRLSAQLWSLSAAALAFCEISLLWALMPPSTTSSTTTASATSESSTIAAPPMRGTRCRSSQATIGIATVATMLAATSGPTIVAVAPSSQTKPTTRSANPTSSHDVRPRSRSQRGAANEVSEPACFQLRRGRLRAHARHPRSPDPRELEVRASHAHPTFSSDGALVPSRPARFAARSSVNSTLSVAPATISRPPR